MPHRMFGVTDANWESDETELSAVREDVFIREQGVSREIEIDGRDGACVHVIARDNSGCPIGTARLDAEGHVGRVAVLKAWRGLGVGTALMNALVTRAIAEGMPSVELHSQTHAAEFYEKLGFVAEGEEFMEADIPHIRMVKVLG